MPGLRYLRFSLLIWSLLVPLAIALLIGEQVHRNAPEWQGRWHQNLHTWVRWPIQVGGPGIVLALLLYWGLTALSEARRGAARALVDAHGLAWFFPVLAALGAGAWYGLRLLVAPRPSDGAALAWQLMERCFLLSLVATMLTLVGFYLFRLLLRPRS